MNDLYMILRRHILVFLTLLLTWQITSAQRYAQARIWFGQNGIAPLQNLGLALDHIHPGEDFVEGDFSIQGLKLAETNGYRVEILHPNAEEAYLKKPSLLSHERNNADCIAGLLDFPYEASNNYQEGSYKGNFTYQEMLDQLDRMAARYPHLITARQEIGDIRTHEGRPIYWIRISDNPEVDEQEPEILYTALHHAREPVSLTQLIYFMWYVLDHYDDNPRINHLLQNTELYFIPCVNPDGYIYNETQRPQGGGLWRKNRRDNGDGTFGVDLNRNYGHKWGYNNAGSSASTNSEVYRGPSAFSEPETQAIRDFVLNHHFQIALNYHAWGNYLIYPYGYTSKPAEDLDVYQELATLLTRENRFLHGTGLETLAYSSNGDADDWMYGDESKDRIFSMTPEVGGVEHGFWPHEDDVEYLCKSALRQNLDAAYFLLNSGMLIDESESFLTEMSGSIPVRLTKLGFEEVGLSMKLESITNNIEFHNSSKLYILDLFSSEKEQFHYTLRSGIQDGERIQFAYTIDNGSYQRTDTITKYYREGRFAFENTGNLTAWNDEPAMVNWGESKTVFYSGPSSLTDSPNGNTTPYTTNQLTSNEFYVEHADSAVLTFRGRWDIQHDFDFMKIEVSLDGETFFPLCGKYSKAGALSRNRNLPVYTGRQLTWVNEEIDLTDYTGQNISIRFTMESTNNSTRDGMYLDDIKVLAYDEGAVTDTRQLDETQFETRIFPNPVRSTLQMATEHSTDLDLAQVRIMNQLGQEVMVLPFQKWMSVDVSDWSPGLYFVLLQDVKGSRSTAKKFMVH